MNLTSTELAALTATEYAVMLNTETRRNAAEEGWTFYTTLVEGVEHWAPHGIHTGLDLAISNAAGTYSDVYKETHGIRPRWMNFENSTLEEIEAELTSLFEYSRLEREAEEAYEAEMAEKAATEARIMDVTLEGDAERCEAMAEAMGY